MRSAFLGWGSGLFCAWAAMSFVLGCTVETHGSGTSAIGSGGASGSTAAGGSSGSAGASAAGTGGAAAGGGAGPSGACAKIWYNGENGQGDVNLAAVQTWTDPSKDPSQGTSMVSESTTNPHGGAASLEVELNWATGYYGGAFGLNFAKYDKASAYDVHAEADFEMWIRTETGNKTHVVVWVTDINGKGSNRVDVTSSSPITPEWRKVTIPVTQFTGVDLTSIWEVDADTHSEPFGVAGGVKFFVDDGAFTSPSCPSK